MGTSAHILCTYRHRSASSARYAVYARGREAASLHRPDAAPL